MIDNCLSNCDYHTLAFDSDCELPQAKIGLTSLQEIDMLVQRYNLPEKAMILNC